MAIGKNIAQIRRKRGLTQEELGARLGVTNQAVSKWENETSLPDVTLLPGIAEALGVTLDALYGLADPKPQRVRADDYPRAAQKKLIESFLEEAGARMPGGATEPGEFVRLLGCVSDTGGCVFVSENLSFIESSFKTPGSEAVFLGSEEASAMRKLADLDVRKVLACLYRQTFDNYVPYADGPFFRIDGIAGACQMEAAAVLDALEKLTALHLAVPVRNESGEAEYRLAKNNAQFALIAFRALRLLTNGDLVYSLLRDTSMLEDYLFETRWTE